MNEEYYFYHQYCDESDPINILTVGQSSVGADFKVRREAPAYSCLEFVTGGSGYYETPFERSSLAAGDVFILYKGVPHTYHTLGDSWMKLWVEFDGSLFDALFNAFLPDKPACVHAPSLEDDFRCIFEWAKSGISYTALCTQATPLIVKILQKLHDERKNSVMSIAEKTKNLIDSNIYDDFKLTDLQRDLFYSQNHLINVFRDRYGVTPYVYYLRKRTELIENYLSSTTLSISEIASVMKFRDVKYMSTFFRHQVGISPLDYRKSRIKNAALPRETSKPPSVSGDGSEIRK